MNNFQLNTEKTLGHKIMDTKYKLFANAGTAPVAGGNEAISEETVRRYLKRRPMTTTDLLKKFR